MPDPARLVVFDGTGGEVGSYPLTIPASDLAGDPPRQVVPTSKGNGAVFWFTGSQTIALSTTDLRPMWTVDETLGAGTVYAGYLLLPVRDGIAVIDQETGARVAATSVNRDSYSGPVAMATLGPMVLEQRGSTLVALR
jgi:hypothetical protein